MWKILFPDNTVFYFKYCLTWVDRLKDNFLGVLTVFKGLIYYFQPHMSLDNILYFVEIENMKVKFIPLGTKMPYNYCQNASDKPCIHFFDNRQLIGFTKYWLCHWKSYKNLVMNLMMKYIWIKTIHDFLICAT